MTNGEINKSEVYKSAIKVFQRLPCHIRHLPEVLEIAFCREKDDEEKMKIVYEAHNDYNSGKLGYQP